MIHKLFQTHPLVGHVAKVSLFLAVQAALWLGLRAGINPSVETMSASYTDAFLREAIDPHWRADHGILETMTNPAVAHPILDRLAASYVGGPDAFLAAVKDKERMLRETSGPRLIFVGGSGLSFGIDSKLLAERYAYHPINLGVHAGLAGEFMLRQAEAHAREGDVVVLCFEPLMMWIDFEMIPRRKEQLLRIAPKMAKYLNPPATTEIPLSERLKDYKTYADAEALPEWASTARRLLGAGYDQYFSGTRSESEQFRLAFAAHHDELIAALRRAPAIANRVYPREIYRRSGYNEFGDLVTHRGRARPATLPDGLRIEDFPTSGDEAAIARITSHLQRLNEFARDCAARGVRAYFLYPPMLDVPVSRDFAVLYESLVEEHLEIPVLNEIDEVILAERFFFDSTNHLTWPGTCFRMKNLITGLDRYLEPRSPLSPARHVAARKRTVRTTLIAAGPMGSAIY